MSSRCECDVWCSICDTEFCVEMLLNLMHEWKWTKNLYYLWTVNQTMLMYYMEVSEIIFHTLINFCNILEECSQDVMYHWTSSSFWLHLPWSFSASSLKHFSLCVFPHYQRKEQGGWKETTRWLFHLPSCSDSNINNHWIIHTLPVYTASAWMSCHTLVKI